MKPNHEHDLVPIWVVVLITLVGILVALSVSFIYVDNPKAISLIGGLIGGLVVYISNSISERWILRKLFSFGRMGIRNILSNRHDKLYYRNGGYTF